MNPVITSRTVTGPGLKSRPMATYCAPSQRAIQRAKAAAAEQRFTQPAALERPLVWGQGDRAKSFFELARFTPGLSRRTP